MMVKMMMMVVMMVVVVLAMMMMMMMMMIRHSIPEGRWSSHLQHREKNPCAFIRQGK